MSLLEADGNLYASKHLSSSSSHRFLSTIMASGTLSDKVSALTLVVQESPVHTTKSFESLLTLAKKRSRGQAVTALGALKDLLGAGVVLPADRRLRTFATQPGLLTTLEQNSVLSWGPGESLPGDISKMHLIYWVFEDWLKESYFDMLKVLEGWCNDEVEYARTRAVGYVYELLKEKPEQEANLLRLLVNKLGDPEKKIASRASYLLLQLQISHPLMKPIIIRSIESELLLRPGQNAHAKYYAINTLNQTILSAKEEDVAMKLLDIYFEQFVSLLKKPEQSILPDKTTVNRKGQIQGGGAPMGKKAKARMTKEEEARLASEETTEKLISAVLTGVNRAFPFSKTDDLT
jgi:ribosome biogenesis protein MAK21